MGFIYQVTNSINGKVYIGQTTRTIEARWKQHLADSAMDPMPCNSYLHNAIKKYGSDAFTVTEIEQCDNADLNDREIYWIDYFDSYNNGYNLSRGGGGWLKTDDDTVLELWENGKGAGEIANELNLHRDTVSQRLKGMGVTQQEIVCRGVDAACKTKKMPKPRKPRKIFQYDIDGNYIGEFQSIEEAEAFIGGEHIVVNSKIKRKLFGGYQWRKFKTDKIEPSYIGAHGGPDKKQVHQYSIDGEYIQSFRSSNEAADFLCVKSAKMIRKACLGEARTAFGYRWTYEKVERLPELEPDKVKVKVIRISENGEEKLYNSVTDAARDNNTTSGDISSACRGRFKTIAGYKWKYATTDTIKEE